MSLLYSSLLMHDFLLDSVMVTIIAAIIKNKFGDNYNNNYRPIALATVASKLFESLILIIQDDPISHYMRQPI